MYKVYITENQLETLRNLVKAAEHTLEALQGDEETVEYMQDIGRKLNTAKYSGETDKEDDTNDKDHNDDMDLDDDEDDEDWGESPSMKKDSKDIFSLFRDEKDDKDDDDTKPRKPTNLEYYRVFTKKDDDL